MTPAQRNQAAFVAWLKMRHPQLYRAAMQSALAGEMPSILDRIEGFISQAVETGSRLAQTYVASRAALETIKTNVARAKEGLAPVNEAGQEIPAEKLTPATAPAASDSSGVLWIGGGLALLWLLSRR